MNEPTALTSIRLTHGSVDLRRSRFHRCDDDVVKLTTKEAQLLEYLAARPHQDVSREELLREVWGYRCTGTTRAVDHTVRRLRAKVEGNPDQPEHVLTVYGHGYRFEPAAQAAPSLPSSAICLAANADHGDASRQIEDILGRVEALLGQAHALAASLRQPTPPRLRAVVGR